MHTTIFSGADLALDVHDGGHPVSIVTFESRDDSLSTDATALFGPGFGRGRFSPLRMNEYLIRRNRNHWYQTPEIERVAELIVDAAHGTRILTYGSSMGAFAAVNFAHMLDADQFIAVSPLFDVGPENELDERRWADDWSHTRFDYNLIKTGVGRESQGYVFYCASSPDRPHAQRIAENTAATLIPLDYGNHPVGFYLNRTYRIKRLISEIAADTFDESAFRREVDAATLETHYPYEREASRLAKNGDGDGAIAQLRIAAEKSPSIARLHANLGAQLLRGGELDDAEHSLTAATAIDPSDADPHVRLSYVHAARKDFGSAAAAMRRAVDIDPHRPEYHLRLGEWLLSDGDYAGAEQAMLRVLELKPGAEHTRRRLAVVRERKAAAASLRRRIVARLAVLRPRRGPGRRSD
ncbi:MAG: tetratricopeptide repeat protein [Microbacterium sp.]